MHTRDGVLSFSFSVSVSFASFILLRETTDGVVSVCDEQHTAAT